MCSASRDIQCGRPSARWDRCYSAGYSTSTTRKAGVLSLVFKIADDNQLLLLDLKDLQAMLQHVGDQAKDLQTSTANFGRERWRDSARAW